MRSVLCLGFVCIGIILFQLNNAPTNEHVKTTSIVTHQDGLIPQKPSIKETKKPLRLTSRPKLKQIKATQQEAERVASSAANNASIGEQSRDLDSGPDNTATLDEAREFLVDLELVDEDLSPEELESLRSLDLSNKALTDDDLRYLAALPNLELVYLENNEITDIAFLAQLPELKSLSLAGTEVTDVSVLANLTELHSLNLSGTDIEDISSLKGLTNLETLSLGGKVSDLTALENMKNLQHLGIYDAEISDISSLQSLPHLQSLHLGGTTVYDASALETMTGIESLTINQLDLEGLDNIIDELPNLKKLQTN